MDNKRWPFDAHELVNDTALVFNFTTLYRSSISYLIGRIVRRIIIKMFENGWFTSWVTTGILTLWLLCKLVCLELLNLNIFAGLIETRPIHYRAKYVVDFV